MSRTVDNRVVEMQFNNAQFESGVKESMNSINNLNKNLNSLSESSKSLRTLSKAGNDVNFNGLTLSLNTVKGGFSALGEIATGALRFVGEEVAKLGKSLISNLLTPINQIKSGGFNRALNIANAKFQFEGLGMDIEKSMEAATFAVNETAYSLDAAAVVASQLGTSGMQAGEEMAHALRAVSGVAAMTNSSYEDIGHIFTTVASNGRLMGEQMTRLSYRGMNVAATLGKYYNKTEAEIKTMASKGQISFKMFYQAMYDTFGEHAVKANETYTGSLANVNAALSKIGADFAQYKLEYMVKVFNSIRLAVNKLRVALTPLSKAYGEIMKAFTNFLSLNIDKFDASSIPVFIDGLANVVLFLRDCLRPLKTALQEMFPPLTANSILELAERFRSFTESLQATDSVANNIKDAFMGLVSIFKLISNAILSVVRVIFPSVDSFGTLLQIVIGLAGFVGRVVTAFSNWAIESGLVTKAMNAIKTTLIVIIMLIAKTIEKVVELTNKMKSSDLYIQSMDKIKSGLSIFLDFIKKIVSAVGGLRTAIANNKNNGSTSVIDYIKNLLFGKGDGAKEVSKFKQMLTEFVNSLTPTKVAIGAFVAFFSGLMITFAVILNKIANSFKQTSTVFKYFKDEFAKFRKSINAKDAKAESAKKFAKFIAIGYMLVGFMASMAALAHAPIDGVLAALTSMVVVIVTFKAIVKDIIEMPDVSTSKFTTLLGIALIMSSIGSALKKASKHNWKQIAAAGLAMAGSILSLGVVIHNIKDISDDCGNLKKMTGLSLVLGSVIGGIMAIGSALNKVAKYDWKHAITAGGTIAACMISLGLVMKAIGGIRADGYSLSKVGALVAMSVVISSFGSSIKKIAKYDWKQISISATALSLALVALGGIMTILSKSSSNAANAIASAASMAIASLSLISIANTINKLTFYNWSDMWKKLIAVSGTLVVMGGILAGLGALGAATEGIGAVAILAAAAAMFVLGESLVLAGKGVELFSKAMKTLSKVANFDTIAKGIILVANSLNELTYHALRLVASGVGIALAGTGIKKFADALVALENVRINVLTSGIDSLFTAIANNIAKISTMGIEMFTFATSLRIASTAILLMTASFIPLGAGLLLAGAGVLAMGAGLKVMEGPLVVFQGIDWLTISSGMVAFGKGLLEIAGAGIILALSHKGLVWGAAALGGIAVEAWALQKVNMESVAAGLAKIAVSGVELGLAGVVMAVGAVGVGSMAVAIGVLGYSTYAAAQLFIAGVEAITKAARTLFDIGSYCVQGFVNGIIDSLDDIADIAKEFGRTFLETVCEFLGIESPSKVMRSVGEFTGSGFILGIADMLEEAEESGEALGLSALEGCEGLGDFATKIGQSLGLDFTDGFNSVINSFLGGKGYSAKGGNGMPSSVARIVDSSKKGLNGLVGSIKDFGKDLLNLDDVEKTLAGSTKEMTESMGDLSSATGGAGKAAKETKSAFDELKDSIHSAIESSVKQFDLFEKKEAMSKDDILTNMRSQVTGMVEWTRDIVELQKRGLSQGLIADLAKMGYEGYDKVQGFLQMTAEEIQQANLYSAQLMMFPESATNSIMNSWVMAGQNFGKGYANGLNPDEANKMAQLLAINSLNTLKTNLDEHSPSRKTMQMGVYFVQGLANGIKGTNTAENQAIILSKNVLEGLNRFIKYSEGKNIGVNVVRGIASGIKEAESLAKDAALSLANKLPSWVRKVLGIQSPSKVFAGIGRFIDMGLAVGIGDNTKLVENSAEALAQNTINGYNAGLSAVYDMDLNPVITPTLDLSNVQAGANQINGMLSNKSISATVDAINQNGSANTALINSLKEEIINLGNKMASMQMVLDSGALVGEIAPNVDQQLGRMAIYAGRGI